MKLNYKFIVLILLCSLSGFAQRDSQYTQYMYNPLSINPAYAGQREVLSVFGMYRNQWVGLDGAPSTTTIAAHSPINDSRMGVGLSFDNDRVGPVNENRIAADLSYTIEASPYYKLSFGLKGSANLLNVDYTKLSIYNPDDAAFQNNIENRFSPNIGAGIYLHSDNTYVGLSIPNFLETVHYGGSDTYSATKQKMHYYLMAGHVFEINPMLMFKPSVLAKIVSGAPFQTDFSANFLINEKLTLGASYRWSASVSAMAGFQISEGLFAGYSYDAETTRLSNYNSGSHEIFLRFEIFEYYERIVSPRFF